MFFVFFLLGRMLQLILGCAVNCDHKQQYIESIMNLEESVQQVLMLAIQEMITSGSTKGNECTQNLKIPNIVGEIRKVFCLTEFLLRL